RPAAQRRVDEANVVAIVAGPGYGKTVLAARAYHAFAGPKLWFGLDRGDADFAVFAAHLHTAIASLGSADAAPDASWRTGSARETGSRFAEMLAEHAALVVFDDVHSLEGSASASVLAEFIERSSRAGSKFLLTGRALPLELHAVAGRLQMVTLGASDLAFSDDEVREYFAGNAARVDLLRRAEGWPAGLALIANAPASRAGAPPGSSDDETRATLFGYLAAEALDNLSERERAFLLDTAILDELQLDVCDAVSGGDDAAEILPSLARRGLFIVRRTEDAFTAHQLFREFLRDRLPRTRPRAVVSDLHRRAARALAALGDHVAEIAHLVEASDLEAAAVRLEAVAFGLLASGQLSRVEALLARLPAVRIDASPTLLTARGRGEQLRGDWDRALASLRRAIASARDANEPDTMAEAVRVASTILASRGEFENLESLLEETLARDDLSEASRTALAMTLGATLLDTGRFDEALEAFDAIMPALVARGDLALQGMVLHNTGCALARRGEPYAALAMYDRALRVKRSAGQRVSTLMTLGNKIFTLRIVGDLDEAERLVRLMLDESYDIGNAAMMAHARENEGALYLLRGSPVEALGAFRAGQAASDPADVFFLPEIMHGLAQALAATGQFAEADAICRNVAEGHRAVDRQQPLAAVLVTRATCAAGLGEPARAFELVREALAVADAGADAVASAAVRIDAGETLLAIAPRLQTPVAKEAWALAAQAAGAAFGLVHEHDYRFLMRTKAKAYEALRAHLARQDGATEPAPAPGLRVELLGGLRVFIDGRPLPADAWKRRRARDLFAYLVSARGRAVPRARLLDLFWPDTDADSAAETLRVTISAIRKAVGDVVKFEANAYRFVPPPGTTIDVVLFEERLERAREARSAGDEATARMAYGEAIALYVGEFLDGYDDGDGQWRERERSSADAVEALRWLASDAAADRTLRRNALDRLLEIAPYDIEAVRTRLEALADEGRTSDAEREYDAWRRRYR
ncbi:MAG: winged helix-turn-helix domain-containing protein, partial [Candidatus Eremiobacteraeota bacterium]|nr:winged helix-turn-helix domain-containing protein [Candidatus Eremiobacteraeota bacterium]